MSLLANVFNSFLIDCLSAEKKKEAPKAKPKQAAKRKAKGAKPKRVTKRKVKEAKPKQAAKRRKTAAQKRADGKYTPGLPGFLPLNFPAANQVPDGKTRLVRLFPREKFRVGGECRYSDKLASIITSRLMFEKNHPSWAHFDFCQFAEVEVDKGHYAYPKKNDKLLFWAGKAPVNVKPTDPRAIPGDSSDEPSLICVHWPGKKEGSVFELCVADVKTVGKKLKLEYVNSVGLVEKINTRVDAFTAQEIQAANGGAINIEVKTEVPVPVPVRTSARATKGERITVRLEDEPSPAAKPRPRQGKSAAAINSEMVSLQVKIARLEGQAESFKERELKLKQQRGNHSTNASSWKQKCSVARAEVDKLKLRVQQLQIDVAVARQPTIIDLNTPELEGKLMVRYLTTKRPKLFVRADAAKPEEPVSCKHDKRRSYVKREHRQHTPSPRAHHIHVHHRTPQQSRSHSASPSPSPYRRRSSGGSGHHKHGRHPRYYKKYYDHRKYY